MIVGPLTDADVGRAVVYVNFDGRREDGVITSLSGDPRSVFVRYSGQHPGASGKATYLSDLEWAPGEAAKAIELPPPDRGTLADDLPGSY